MNCTANDLTCFRSLDLARFSTITPLRFTQVGVAFDHTLNMKLWTSEHTFRYIVDAFIFPSA